MIQISRFQALLF